MAQVALGAQAGDDVVQGRTSAAAAVAFAATPALIGAIAVSSGGGVGSMLHDRFGWLFKM